MPSVQDNLTIASRAIENALTASSAQKITATQKLSAIHRRKGQIQYQHSGKKPPDENMTNVLEQTEHLKSKHIDLKA